jgi:hypothetical protein
VASGLSKDFCEGRSVALFEAITAMNSARLFAAGLRELVAAHIRSTFARAFPKMPKKERELKLEVADAVMLSALQAMPGGPEVERLAQLTQTKAAVSLYANASFVHRAS